MTTIDFSFDSIDFTIINKINIESNKTNIESNKTNIESNKINIESNKTNIESNKTNIESNKTNIESNKSIKPIPIEYDKTTNETYRVKRLFKIDPITDQEVPDNLAFKFIFSWNPCTGVRGTPDIIGPLYFNVINLYDYYYLNRYNGLWNQPQEQFQGYYGDYVGTGKNIKITSRGYNPEKYLFRLPIIDCYLLNNHNYSVITMGPELTDDEISQCDKIIIQSHPKKSLSNFASLTLLKYYYDRALDVSPDPNCDEIKELKQKYPSLSQREINEKYNRYWVDKLVKLKY